MDDPVSNLFRAGCKRRSTAPIARLTRVSWLAVIISGVGLVFSAYGQTPREQAWSILQSGLASSNSDSRTSAVTVLSAITADRKAVELAEHALADQDPDVRAAAAGALGALKSRQSIPMLRAALKDTSGSVVMASARALVCLKDEAGYEVYYALITGERKSGQGLVAGEKSEMNDVLKHPNKLASQAFEQGIGFVPFGGVTFGAYQAFHKSGEADAAVRATAVKMLARDPDPRSGKALVEATTDKNWVVRAAAFESLAIRGDHSLAPDAVNGLSDSNETVKFMAAAAIVQLSTTAKAAAD